MILKMLPIKLEIKILHITDLEKTIARVNEIRKAHPKYVLDVQIKVGV